MFQSVVPDDAESKETRQPPVPNLVLLGVTDVSNVISRLRPSSLQSPARKFRLATGDWWLETCYCCGAAQLNELGSRSFSPITPNAASEKPISTAGNGTGTVTSAR